MRPTIAIIGLGLIGGSLARDLAALGHRVLGTDADFATLDAALAQGVVADAFRLEEFDVDQASAGVLAEARIAVIATPVRAAPRLLTRLAIAACHDAILTDVGSTKRSIAAAATEADVGHRFVGGHPMAGDHRAGWGASREGLFQGATVWICPGSTERATSMIEALWRSVGAVPQRIEPAEHDCLVAWTSHLPQLVASALGLALRDQGVAREQLGPGGGDATRLAASDPGLWSDILSDNADAIEPALEAAIDALTRFHHHLAARDADAVRGALAEAREWGTARAPR